MKVQLRKKAILHSAAGFFLCGFGSGIYVLCAIGSDCFNALGIVLSARSGLQAGTVAFIMQAVLLSVAFCMARRKIGIGTILGIAEISLVMNVMESLLTDVFLLMPLILRIVLVALTPIIIGLGTALEQKGGLGLTAYDIVSIAIAERIEKISFGTTRILYDCAFLCVSIVLGGSIGIGNLLSAFLAGPWIQFFSVRLKRNGI